MKIIYAFILVGLLFTACGDKGGSDAEGSGENGAASEPYTQDILEKIKGELSVDGYEKPAGNPNGESALFSMKRIEKGVDDTEFKALISMAKCAVGICKNMSVENFKKGTGFIKKEYIKDVEETTIGGHKAFIIYAKGYKETKTESGTSRSSQHLIQISMTNDINIASVQLSAHSWPQSEEDLDKVSKEEILKEAKKVAEVVATKL